jgi:phage major head subunit gpT-like protein
MIINSPNLRTLYIAFNAAFANGLGMAPSQFDQIATSVPSTTGTEEYGWLGQFPNMREWIGDRVVNSVKNHGYSVKNKTFEVTVGVPRENIEDDTYGLFTPMMTEMGRSVAAQPDQLVFGLLGAANTTVCYDGQYYFDTDHPVTDANGVVQSQSNTIAGANPAWYLLDASRALKPLIFQNRKSPNFVAKANESDDNVFFQKEYVYGVDARRNVGLGFWQMAQRSQATLDEAGLTAAFTAMTTRTGDNGRPLGLRPTLLVVPPSLEFAAEKLLVAIYGANGASNVFASKAKVLTSPWLQ